jgi:cell division protease FtsH
MVTQLGMSESLGPIRYGTGHGGDVFLGRDLSSSRDYSEATAAAIDEEVKRIIDEAYALARQVLTEHADKLKFVAEYLLAHEIMDGDQFRAAMEADEPTFEALEAIAEEKSRRSREANEERERRNHEREEQERAQREREEQERREREAAEQSGSAYFAEPLKDDKPQDDGDTDENNNDNQQ